MYSLSIDYIFNRVYDVLLWIKYTWFFTILRKNPETYIDEHTARDWDGLRDRGWFDAYFAQKNATVPPAEIQVSLWQRMLESLGLKVRDSDGDGIPDVTDSRPFDQDNLSKAELKERYEEDYTFFDHVRDTFGIGPKDSDKDGVPDSYEIKHSLDTNNPDSDRDGVLDGQELTQGTNPLNNDTDGDMVIDGRDEAPLSSEISSIGKDSDEDGVSDFIEKIIGTDSTKKDTDQDGISDSMDTYPLDPENLSQIASFNLHDAPSLHFSIQNPVLALFADTLSLVAIVLLLIFVYAVARWFTVFVEGLNHYDHHFHHDDHHTPSHKGHVIQDGKSSNVSHEMPAGIAGLPVGDGIPNIVSHNVKEIVDHPKFSVIQGYINSDSEALWRIGIMEADNLLLESLAEKGYQGDGVGEKLKGASFKTIDLAWDAHKVRNRIAHEGSDFQLTEREAKRTFMLFESVFRDLKVIR